MKKFKPHNQLIKTTASMMLVVLFSASSVVSLYPYDFMKDNFHFRTQADLDFVIEDNELEESADDKVRTIVSARKDCQPHDVVQHEVHRTVDSSHYPDTLTQPPEVA